jgi:hypothetical protein
MQLHGWEAVLFYVLAFMTLIMGVCGDRTVCRPPLSLPDRRWSTCPRCSSCCEQSSWRAYRYRSYAV